MSLQVIYRLEDELRAVMESHMPKERSLTREGLAVVQKVRRRRRKRENMLEEKKEEGKHVRKRRILLHLPPLFLTYPSISFNTHSLTRSLPSTLSSLSLSF